MARIVCTTVVIVLLSVLVGCRSADSGSGLVTPDTGRSTVPISTVNLADVSETDLVEQMAVNRQAYQRGLELLVGYYAKSGNNMKLQWAEKELAALRTMPKYKYITEAGIAGPNLEPSASIPAADDVYYEALELERRAGPVAPFRNENQLRLALEKYNQLISDHPASDKIDDAAYKAAVIYEHFKDYSIALLYYQRAYEWDPDTIYPARFRSARILDKQLHRNAEALERYQQAIETEGRYEKYREWTEFAQDRIRALQKTSEG